MPACLCAVLDETYQFILNIFDLGEELLFSLPTAVFGGLVLLPLLLQVALCCFHLSLQLQLLLNQQLFGFLQVAQLLNSNKWQSKHLGHVGTQRPSYKNSPGLLK